MGDYRFFVNDDCTDFVLECWGASTKHPDSYNQFSRDCEKGRFIKSSFIELKHQVFQWLLFCASDKDFPFHAEDLATWALENFVNWKGDGKEFPISTEEPYCDYFRD